VHYHSHSPGTRLATAGRHGSKPSRDPESSTGGKLTPFCLAVVPVGSGQSLVEPVTAAVDAIRRAGLDYRLTGADTVIEGNWDEVMPVIQRAEERLREKHDRVFMVLTIDDHKGSENRLSGAVEDVEDELGR